MLPSARIATRVFAWRLAPAPQLLQVRGLLTLKKSPVLPPGDFVRSKPAKAVANAPDGPSPQTSNVSDGSSPRTTTARLAKRIALAGVCSRREAEKRIESRQVTVNGRVVTDVATVVDLARDVVAVGGRPLAAVAQLKVWLAHKLPGVR